MASLLGRDMRRDCGTAPKIFLYLFLLFLKRREEEAEEIEEEKNLTAPSRDEPIKKQQQHRADDRHDPMRGVVLVSGKHFSDPGADKSARNTEQHRDNATARIATRHQ